MNIRIWSKKLRTLGTLGTNQHPCGFRLFWVVKKMFPLRMIKEQISFIEVRFFSTTVRFQLRFNQQQSSWNKSYATPERH
jgi:nuclear transport factor 2 (NTF2) superfamily protein